MTDTLAGLVFSGLALSGVIFAIRTFQALPRIRQKRYAEKLGWKLSRTGRGVNVDIRHFPGGSTVSAGLWQGNKYHRILECTVDFERSSRVEVCWSDGREETHPASRALIRDLARKVRHSHPSFLEGRRR